MQERELIKKLRSGDEQAYKRLFDFYADRIYNICVRFLNSRQEAEDAVQDIFCKIYFSIDRFREDARLTSWIYRISVNHCLNAQRQKRRARFFSLDWLSEGEMTLKSARSDDPQDSLEKKETESIIQAAINGLSEKQRTALVLFRYEGLTYQEIAEVLNISVAAVESRLFQAKQELCKKLLPLLKDF
ncbi:sigma-70 family RNA polymerase sigma factor [candidate division KSB1 bacterium]|nr:sigma-70 family RNA polymerase sigma factor [candidate division KSB1 bacterium]